MSQSWREYARPIIADVIRGCGYPKGCDLAFIRKALRGTYPFGERKHWPYKIWCDEVRRQLKAAESGRPLIFANKIITPDARQMELVG